MEPGVCESVGAPVSSVAAEHEPSLRLGLATSLTARIAAHAAVAPARVATADEAARLTYGELELRSNRLAAYLRQIGVVEDSCVALCMERSCEFVIAALAVMKAGAAYLPIDPTTPSDRVAFILSDAGARQLISHRGKAAALGVTSCEVIELDGAHADTIAKRPAVADDAQWPSSGLAYVIYTSGSTGRPKGVEITRGNLLNLIEWHQQAFDVSASDRASQVAGLGFDAAVWEIWPYLAAGASVHFADELTRRSPQALRDWLVTERISVAFVPTILAEQLINSTWPRETSLRFLLTGADTLHRRPATGLPFGLVNNYGPTECTVVATSGIVQPDQNATGSPSIGRPIANTTAFILDAELRSVSDGEPGELCLAGAHVGRGYRNNPSMTAERFVMFTPSPGEKPVRVYRTGDRANRLPSGEIAFLGRLDDQVKIRGYRVELGEIVAWLDKFSGIEASAVVARDTDAGPELVAYVIASKDVKLTGADLREFMAARLPDYMVPARFVAISELPITANGKLDKAALPAPTSDNVLSNGDTSAPVAQAATNVEQVVAEMVASLLGQPFVNRDDNFFMLGGHSMLGVQLVARIRDTLGVKLTLRQLFTAPTVAALSAEVVKLTASSGPSK